MASNDEALKAKVALRSMIKGQPWLRGIGISADDKGAYVTVRVAKEAFDSVTFPAEVNGVRVVKEVGEIAVALRKP